MRHRAFITLLGGAAAARRRLIASSYSESAPSHLLFFLRHDERCILSEADVYGSAEFSVRATTGSKYAIGRRCTPNNPTSLFLPLQARAAGNTCARSGRRERTPTEVTRRLKRHLL